MRQIYSNAILTIAADCSVTANSGFISQSFRSFTEYWWKFTSVSISVPEKCHFIGTKSLIRSGEIAGWEDVMESALHKRGWALQESILANL